MGRVTTRVPRVRIDVGSGTRTSRPDTVVVEEPLELRVGADVVGTTMRTPGDDFDLALGHLLTEGLVGAADDIAGMMHCTDVDASGAPTFNVVDITLRPGAALLTAPRARTEQGTSACGVCGSRSVDDVRTHSRYAVGPGPAALSPAWVVALPEALRTRQATFERTGGVHAAGIAAPEGALLMVREDIGRHNAVDKVIGALARTRPLPLTDLVLVVSARASFEIVQKAAMVGLPVVVAVGAPSSLAVALAVEAGITLVAFARDGSCSAYAHADRLAAADHDG
jgi:FdhD protein